MVKSRCIDVFSFQQNESIAYSLETAKKKIQRLRREKRCVSRTWVMAPHCILRLTQISYSILLDTISRSSEFAYSSPEPSDSFSDNSMSDVETDCKLVTISFSSALICSCFENQKKSFVVPPVPVHKPQIVSNVGQSTSSLVRNQSTSSETLSVAPSTSRPVSTSAKPKRMRKGPVAVKVRRIQPLERDPITNDYKLPARIGILTVHTLGHIVWQYDTYHNDRYIWPVGFCVSR